MSLESEMIIVVIGQTNAVVDTKVIGAALYRMPQTSRAILTEALTIQNTRRSNAVVNQGQTRASAKDKGGRGEDGDPELQALAHQSAAELGAMTNNIQIIETALTIRPELHLHAREVVENGVVAVAEVPRRRADRLENPNPAASLLWLTDMTTHNIPLGPELPLVAVLPLKAMLGQQLLKKRIGDIVPVSYDDDPDISGYKIVHIF